MKFILCLFPVGAFIAGSGSLYIPPAQLEQINRELAPPNAPPIFADGAYKKKSWPSHVGKPGVQKHAVLAKRTTDEESANSQKDVDREKNAREGRIVYTAEEMAGLKEEYNTAARALYRLQTKLQKAKDAGLEASEGDVHELSRLKSSVSQQLSLLTKARLGKPLDRVRKLDVGSLEQDPEIQELAKLGPYDARQLAEYKRSLLDADSQFRTRRGTLAKAAEVRKITEAEEEELADLKRVYNIAHTMWRRARKGGAADRRAPAFRLGMDDLLESPKLHEIAQSSGYTVEELAETKRRWLDSLNAARAFKKKLNEVKKVREVTLEEKGQLQALVKVISQEETVFNRMSQGLPIDQRVAPRHKSIDNLMESSKLHEIAQLSGYAVEELATAQRRWLDSKNALYAFRKELAGLENLRKVTPEEDEQLQALVKTVAQLQTVFRRMSRGTPVQDVQTDPAVEPALKLGRIGVPVPALQLNANVGEGVRPVTYTPEQVAMLEQQHLEALEELLDFQDKISAFEQSGRPITREEEDELAMLRNVYNQRREAWSNVRRGLSVYSPGNDWWPVAYTAQEIANYNRLFLDAQNKLRAFQKRMAAVRQAGHSPILDDEAQLRALKDDFSKKKTMWIRAREGRPVDRAINKRRRPKTVRPPDTGLPGSQKQTTKASSAKEDPSTYTPHQIATLDQQHLEALDELLDFQDKIFAIERSGRPASREQEAQLEILRDVYNQRRAAWSSVRHGLFSPRPANTAPSEPYPAQENAEYNRLFNDAQNKLIAFKKKIAAARQAGHSPSPDDKAHLRALQDDFNTKRTIRTRARKGKPVDIDLHKRRGPKTAQSPEANRPGSQEQASQPIQAKTDPSPTQRPLRISGLRGLFAPVLSSARWLLRGVGRQWGAMPWTHYLANPRLEMANPAELLRAEHALL
ncbi:MAG: hypothetical protein M1826_004014 [Phylliscum demangeonii]|nr:MAG: hypothetical protein M1826_004014 [Phylliscum demangeonii]